MPEWSAADREAYLALALVPGIGAARMSALLDRLETPANWSILRSKLFMPSIARINPMAKTPMAAMPVNSAALESPHPPAVGA